MAFQHDRQDGDVPADSAALLVHARLRGDAAREREEGKNALESHHYAGGEEGFASVILQVPRFICTER